MRTFARHLKIHPGTLSQILSGKRALSNDTVKKLGDALGLDPRALSRFTTQLKAESTQASIEIAYDTFNAIADYYHDAILELTHTKTFRGEIAWIAGRLRISPVKCAAAVERLQRLGLLKIEDDGTWTDVLRDNTNDIDPTFTNSAMRKHQSQLLQLSQEALETLPRTQRDHVSNIFACNPQDLPEIKRRVSQFRKELVAFIQRESASLDEVCALNFSIFPLSNSDLNLNPNLKLKSDPKQKSNSQLSETKTESQESIQGVEP